MRGKQPLEEKVLSRKFLIFALLLGLSSAAMFLSMATFDEWAEFAKWAFGIYAASNVAAKYTDMKGVGQELTHSASRSGQELDYRENRARQVFEHKSDMAGQILDHKSDMTEKG